MAMTSYFKNYGHCSTLFRPLQEKFLKWRLFPLRRGKMTWETADTVRGLRAPAPPAAGEKIWVDRSEFLD